MRQCRRVVCWMPLCAAQIASSSASVRTSVRVSVFFGGGIVGGSGRSPYSSAQRSMARTLPW